MINKIKMVLYHIYVYIFRNNAKYINLYWFNKEQNFGDFINPYLISKLSGKKAVWIKPKYCVQDHYLCIGSILHERSKNTIVWGSGFLSNNILKLTKPKKIFAVRGPKSRQLLIDNNIDCPEVYGDPALLLPMFYTPKIRKKYKVGIVPHYVDKNSVWLNSIKNNMDVNVIDIQQNDPLNFIDELLECEAIISSSLHGLIVSDAYGIPSIWVQFSTNITGNNFKFYDYFASVERNNEKPFFVNTNTLLKDIMNNKREYKINIDLDKLINSCPFKDKDFKYV